MVFELDDVIYIVTNKFTHQASRIRYGIAKLVLQSVIFARNLTHLNITNFFFV